MAPRRLATPEDGTSPPPRPGRHPNEGIPPQTARHCGQTNTENVTFPQLGLRAINMLILQDFDFECDQRLGYCSKLGHGGYMISLNTRSVRDCDVMQKHWLTGSQ